MDGSPEAVILESILDGFAEYYSLNLAREVNKGMRENALKARHNGGIPPLGYKVNSERQYELQPEEVPIVRMIFDMFLAGFGYDRIIHSLNSNGYRTKNGEPFGKNSIQAILRNEKYCGTYVFNLRTAKDENGRRNNHTHKDDGDIIRIEDAVPAIISKEDFQNVKEKMTGRQRSRAQNSAKEVYLLSGKMVCGECGAAYVGDRKNAGRSKTPHITYRDNRRDRQTSAVCTNKELRREYIETFILEKLSSVIFSDDKLRHLAHEYNAFLAEQNTGLVSEKRQLNEMLKDAKKKIANTVESIARTGSDALDEFLQKLERDEMLIRSRLKEIESQDVDAIDEATVLKAFIYARELFLSGKLTTTKELVDLYVDTIFVYHDHIEVVLNVYGAPRPLNPTDGFRMKSQKNTRENESAKKEADEKCTHENVCALMVEARGVEPLSEIPKTWASPSAAVLLRFPSSSAEWQALDYGSFINPVRGKAYADWFPAVMTPEARSQAPWCRRRG